MLKYEDLLICATRYCLISQKRHLVTKCVETILDHWNKLDFGSKKTIYSDIKQYLYHEEKCADIWQIVVDKYKDEL